MINRWQTSSAIISTFYVVNEKRFTPNKKKRKKKENVLSKWASHENANSGTLCTHTHWNDSYSPLSPRMSTQNYERWKIQRSQSGLSLKNGEFVAQNKTYFMGAMDRNFWLHSFTIFTIQRLLWMEVESRLSRADLNIVNCKLKIGCIPQLAAERKIKMRRMKEWEPLVKDKYGLRFVIA